MQVFKWLKFGWWFQADHTQLRRRGSRSPVLHRPRGSQYTGSPAEPATPLLVRYLGNFVVRPKANLSKNCCCCHAWYMLNRVLIAQSCKLSRTTACRCSQIREISRRLWSFLSLCCFSYILSETKLSTCVQHWEKN